jgi:hypothetical protein
VSSPTRDWASRYLGLIVRLLPESRRQWGHAMLAELATIERSSERRRFALSCTRVALFPARALAHLLATAGAAGLVLVAAVALTNLIGPAVPVLLALALLAWLGRRPGAFGPVGPERAARVVRACGFALVGLFLLIGVVQNGLSGLFRPHHNGPVVTVLLTFLAAAFLAITARGSRLGSAALASGAVAGLAAGLAAFLVLPFAQHAAPLAAGLPASGTWLALVAFGAPAAAALVTGRRTRRADQAVTAALCAGTFAALVAALLGLGAIALFPGQIPHLAGEIMMPGTSAAAREAEDAIAASDQYAGLLTLGALLAAIMWAAARPPSRAWMTVGLLVLLGLPPVVLGSSARDFPGATAITFATLMVVIGAVVTTRPGTARAS